MRAVYWMSKMSSKCLTSISVTTAPSSVGLNLPWSLVTYSRSWIVVRIDAYVDGRPMPFSSSAFTSEEKGIGRPSTRSEEHTSELQSRADVVCRTLLENKIVKS